MTPLFRQTRVDHDQYSHMTHPPPSTPQRAASVGTRLASSSLCCKSHRINQESEKVYFGSRLSPFLVVNQPPRSRLRTLEFFRCDDPMRTGTMSREKFGRGLLSTGFRFSPVELDVSAWVVGRGRGEGGRVYCDPLTSYIATYHYLVGGKGRNEFLAHGLLGERWGRGIMSPLISNNIPPALARMQAMMHPRRTDAICCVPLVVQTVPLHVPSSCFRPPLLF